MADVSEKILIDTNIIVNLEDNKEIGDSYSELNRLCGENGIQILVHESSYGDILQDKNENRKKISLSKLEKYPKVNRTHRVLNYRKKRSLALSTLETTKSIPIY